LGVAKFIKELAKGHFGVGVGCVCIESE
jgi:hypothetical protein